MKLVYLIATLILSFSAYAQGPDQPASKRVQPDPALKQTMVHLDGLDFDYRVLRHYDQQTLMSLPASKRKQIYFLYTASYTVLNTGTCPGFDLLDLDLASLEIYRKADEPVTLETGGACRVLVQLMSRTECQRKMEELVK